MSNKKLYSFRFDTGLIEQIDEIAVDNYTNRTEYLTRLMVKDLQERQLRQTVGNESVGHSLQG
jgi:hypothetical protein